MSESKPIARYSTERMGWDIWLDTGTTSFCLTDFTSSSETEEEAWEKWEQHNELERMNIGNYL